MTGEAVTGISGYTPFLGSYQNQVLLGDMMGLNSGWGLGMDTSIFGGLGGFNSMMPFGGWNYDSYFNNMDKYQQFMYDTQIRQAERSRTADLKANAPMEAIAHKAEVLHEKIMQNEQEQIIPALRAYVTSVREGFAYGSEVSDEQLLAKAGSLYKQMYNTTMTEDIRKYGNGSFTQGLLQTLTFGIADKRTAEDNIAVINEQPVSRWEKGKKYAGNATGGAIIGAASMYVLSSLKYFKNVFKSKPLVAAGIGAVIGALSGIGLSAAAGSGSNKIS